MSPKSLTLLGYNSLLRVGKLRKFDSVFQTVLVEGSAWMNVLTCKSRRRSVSTCFPFLPPPLAACGSAVFSPPEGPDAPLRCCCLGRGALERDRKLQ